MSSMPYEKEVRHLCGAQWRSLPDDERNAAWGIAIVAAVLNGVSPDLHSLSSSLNTERDVIYKAFMGLSMSGAFQGKKIEQDRTALRNGDIHTWGYYGGYASAATGWKS